MKLNVPNINLTGDNNQEIVDILHRYRKELNFLLMNLDESNMPGVANRLEGLDGSFSQISQEVDQISLTVYDPATGLAELNIRANSIESTVSAHTTTLGQHSTAISQNATAITLKASVGEVVNYLSVNQSGVQINAGNIDLTGITTLYSTTSGRYVRYNAAGDFSCYEQNSAFFSVYNAGGGDFSLLRYGTAFLNASSLVSGVSAYGIWDFSSATVNGLTVRFG